MTVKLISSAILLTAVLLGCTGVPKGLKPVSEFDGQRYMGKWYEIARLDHSFERNLSNVSATYAIDSAGVISVINRGYNEKTGEWKQIEGRARFIGDNTVGSLKVSFFGPFYGGYHVIALDKENYSYAMVAGPNLSYLWILSRSTSLDESILSNLTGKAAEWGFETSELIAIRHDRDENS
jgi:apolipoprotein D and lipocalin family protein